MIFNHFQLSRFSISILIIELWSIKRCSKLRILSKIVHIQNGFPLIITQLSSFITSAYQHIASTQAGNFRRHLKTHPEEKSQLNKKEHFSQIENWIMTAIVFLWKNLKIGPLGGAHVNFNNARNRCLQGYPLHVSNVITIYIL